MCRRTLVGAKLCAGCWSFWSRLAFRPLGIFLEKRHQNTQRSRVRRVTAPADLEPPKGLRLGLGLGLQCTRSGVGLVWADVQS